MNTLKKTIFVPKNKLKKINEYLTYNPKSKEECFPESNTITYTCDFGNGYEMDIKCCGVKYDEESEYNTAWTEAVLFKNGAEVCCSEPSDVFEGEWYLEISNTVFVVNVEEGVGGE